MENQLHITKEEIAALEPGRFEGKIYVIDQLEQVKEAIEEISSWEYVGIDTETKPAFRKGEKHPVALLQIATPNEEVFLFRLSKIGIPNDLVRFLEDPTIFKFGIALRDDVKELIEKRKHHPKAFVELTGITKKAEIVNAGLRGLVAMFLKIRISKSQQRSNWGADQYTQAQLNYAATDAWACCKLFEKLDEEELVPDNLGPYIIIAPTHD